MNDIIDGLPNISSHEIKNTKFSQMYSPFSNINFDKIQSSFGIALHMHQPTIPASTDDLSSAELISNLQYMLEHQDIGDNHNCYFFDFTKRIFSNKPMRKMRPLYT